MDAEPPPSGSSVSPLKAAAIMVVFVVATFVLVAYGTRAVTAPTGTPSSAATTSTTTVPVSTTTLAPGQTTTSTTAATHASTTTGRRGRRTGATTTTTTVPHSTVSVVVANATTTNGLAAHYSTVIGAGGWNMMAPADADTSEATSAVYYAPGQQEAAASIATAIGVKPAQVLPISSSTPVSSTTGLDVIVVIGQDLAAASGT